MADTSPKQAAAAAPSGLEVVRYPSPNCGWYVRHAASGVPATARLRLKRHAVAARTELYSTGLDFGKEKDNLRSDPEWADACKVMLSWKRRSHLCCEGDEHYSPHTYRNDEKQCSGGAPPFRMFEAD